MTDRSKKLVPRVRRREKAVKQARLGRPPTPGMREALLASGLVAMHARGYHATGVAEIVDGAHAPKGTFYAQFESKDAFGAEVVDTFAQGFLIALDAALGDAREPSALARVRAYFEARVAHYHSNGCVRGCLLGNFALELSGDSEPIRLRVRAQLAAFAERLARALEAAQDAGEVRRDRSADDLGKHLVRAWEGALLAMRVERSTAPLRDFVNVMLGDFLATR